MSDPGIPEGTGSVARRRGVAIAGALVLGLVVGLFVGGMASGVLAYVYVQKKAADVRRGWNLIPVVVASADLPEGTVVMLDQIAQRAVPEQFVTSSVVRPESVSQIVNQRIVVPIQAGDPLLWTQFATRRMPVVLVAA